MELGSPPNTTPLKPRDRVVRRLVNIGVPEEFLNYSGLVTFTKDNVSRIPDIVSAILPLDDEVAEVIREAKAGNKRVSLGPNMKHRYRESMVWLQWLMFKGEPDKALKRLSRIGHHGVCGAVWGYNDIAYKCRTCEHDPTCAICVSCFQNGNHKDHDYSITYSSTGGCCDCGDVTALNYEGFCSKHKGAEQIQPLPEKFANSVGPVLDALLICWKNKLSFAEIYGQENSRVIDTVSELRKAANELTFALVEMLLEFCKNSESLLGFISKSVTALAGLLEILVRAERFLSEVVVRKLHELLLKLLREPVFKYEFAKVFLGYYPDCVNEAIRECSDNAKNRYPLQSTFSVQIFMVPTLTPRLVKEMNLLEMLLGCLFDIFISCAGEDGCLQVKKWANLYYTTIRVITDICFVMSHLAVSKYATHYQTGVSKIWMKILAFVQGMNPHKRETGIHVKEENEFVSYPLDLDNCIANIQPFWVDGALSFSGSEETNDDFNMKDVDYGGSLGNAKVGHLSQESFVCDAMRRSSQSDCASKATDVMYEIVYDVLVPPAVMSLIHECLREMENWLGINENTSACLQDVPSPNTNSISGSNFLALKKTLSKFQKGKHIFSRLTGSSEVPAACISNSRAMVSGESDLVASCSAGSNGGGMEGEDLHVLSLCHWPDIIYDVSLQDISVHIPLHRLLSLTLQKALRRCYGETAAPKLTGSESENSLSAVDMDFFGHVLGRCHPYGFSAFVMEHPLRIRVFCAQVHAGMWHKNGDTALSSFEWYRSQRWSEQGLELDLFLLQCCAALSPPNLFVHRIIERFGLLHYLSLLPECLSEYEPVLVKEMLTLMIQVIQERRFCGLRTAESLKRELVHNLAIGDATHSQLVKSLPRDLSKFDQLQEILDSVAMFSNPSDFNQGMYSLRLPCWKELDLYHSCWSLRDFQVAEERYLQFCSVSAMTTQLPRWTKIYHPLEGIASIATCEVILKLIRAVLFYAVFSDKMMEPRTPYSVLITALHLLALALDICFQKRKPGDQSCGDSIPLLALAAEEIPDGLLWGAGNQSLLSLLVLLMRTHKKDNLNNFMEAGHCTISSLIESLLKKFAEIDSRCMTKLQQLAPEVVSHLSCPPSGATVSCSDSDSEKHKEKVRERQAAILEKIKAEQNKFLSSISTNADNDSKSKPGVSNSNLDHDSEESVQDVCSLCHDPNSTTPVSYLILLQKSRLLSFVDRVPPSWDQAHRLSKGNCSMITDRMADQLGTNSSSSAQMAGNAINQYCNEKPGEANALLEFFKAQFPSVRNIHVPSTSSSGRKSNASTLEMFEQDMYSSICKEMCDNVPNEYLMKEGGYSAAEGGLESSRLAESVLFAKYVSALSMEMQENPSPFEASSGNRTGIESTSQPVAYGGFGPTDCDGIHLSSCGHAVHQGCLERYLSLSKERCNRRIILEGGHIVDPDQGEFLCPLCRQLANSVLPVLSGDLQKVKQPLILSSGSSFVGNSFLPVEKNNSLWLHQALLLLQSAANVVGKGVLIESFPQQRNEKMASSLDLVSHVIGKMYFHNKQNSFIGSARVGHPMIMWDTLKYTLMSMEIAARCERTSLTPIYDINALYKELKSSRVFVLSLLLKVVQSMRSRDSLHVLQRFVGVQLFAESICSGVSRDYSNIACEGGGNISSIVKNADTEVSYPDIKFWNWASDPVLAHDPFSSLMWVLFCLPCPFISCKESVLSLVHMFYAVTIVQAVISYCGRPECKTDGIGFSECLITDISKLLGGFGSAREYFISNYVDPSCEVKDMIRKFSFPFLRRCALLWKLLNSTASAPFSDRDDMFDQSFHDIMDSYDGALGDLNEIQKLEKLFKIPPLDFLLEDEVLRTLVHKWFHHFCKKFEVHGFQTVLYSNPAVPLKLMQLPHLYQDLLQRYVKQRCPDCKSVLHEPALCLLCGRLCSPSWKSCCRESECQTHAQNCGAGTGVFLLIRITTILLQRCSLQTPWPSPYLDAYGEEDIGMHRGKPLFLNEERYAVLTYMVATHGLDRSSKVLDQTTIEGFFLV